LRTPTMSLSSPERGEPLPKKRRVSPEKAALVAGSAPPNHIDSELRALPPDTIREQLVKETSAIRIEIFRAISNMHTEHEQAAIAFASIQHRFDQLMNKLRSIRVDMFKVQAALDRAVTEADQCQALLETFTTEQSPPGEADGF